MSTKKQLTVEQVKADLDHKIKGIRDFIDQHIANDGDTSETSQRMNMLNLLGDFESAVNGIEHTDLITDPVREALKLRLAEGERNAVYAISEFDTGVPGRKIPARIVLQFSGGGPAEELIIRANKDGHFSSAEYRYLTGAFGDAVRIDLTGEETFLLLNSADDGLVGGPLMDQPRATALKTFWLPMVRDHYHYEQVRTGDDLPSAVVSERNRTK